jgi:adenylate kinase
MKIKPSLVCVFEQAEDVCVRRVSTRRIDPETGQAIEIDKFVPESPEQEQRLIQMKEDTEEVVRRRFQMWNQSIPRIEDAYKKVLINIQSDNLNSKQISDIIADAIQNPIY